ncbi:threonine--tRNA ligase, cytoplasmic-like [Tachypleus tridentatus]|uniref:threonine--tRNA ligase, cytoplasmic-like n=1 Tax=Tachypleus tridentatus TaxID=6853 RepID=UPI003FD12313
MILDSEECFSVPINIFFILRRVLFSNISHQRCHLNKLVKSKEEMATKRMTELNPWPSYIQDRIELWDKFHAKYKQQLAEKQLDTIKITLPNGEVRDGQAWCTTPYQIAQEIRYETLDILASTELHFYKLAI